MAASATVAESIADLLAARVDDDRAGLVFEDRAWTWAEVVEESVARAVLLHDLGLAGGHIGVLLDNLPEYVFLLGAAARRGRPSSAPTTLAEARRSQATFSTRIAPSS